MNEIVHMWNERQHTPNRLSGKERREREDRENTTNAYAVQLNV